MSYLRHCYKKLGYKEVMTPNLYNKKLWEISGHWDKYKENMFIINKKSIDTENDSDEGIIVSLILLSFITFSKDFRHEFDIRTMV